MYYIYVLYDKFQDKFYIGFTNNLKRRLSEHDGGKTRTTSRMKSLDLIYYEANQSKTDALKREKQLKSGFGRRYLRKRVQDHLNLIKPG